MYELILWIVIIFMSIMNIIYLVKINYYNKIFEIQDDLIQDLFNEIMKNAEELTIDDIADMEDFI